MATDLSNSSLNLVGSSENEGKKDFVIYLVKRVPKAGCYTPLCSLFNVIIPRVPIKQLFSKRVL